MRVLFLCLLMMGLLHSCGTNYPQPSAEKEMTFEENDEGEYEIIVFDSQYETFLATRAFPKEFYSESYYKNRNTFLVTEWNMRHNQPMRYDPNLYEVSIDYNPQIDYGLDFEYRLYNFFMFVEWKYGVDLDGRVNRYR